MADEHETGVAADIPTLGELHYLEPALSAPVVRLEVEHVTDDGSKRVMVEAPTAEAVGYLAAHVAILTERARG